VILAISLIKQPGRRFGPAPKPREPRTVDPLTPGQRRANYAFQLHIWHNFVITSRQRRRLVKKANRMGLHSDPV
jgi:hypothetical protein